MMILISGKWNSNNRVSNSPIRQYKVELLRKVSKTKGQLLICSRADDAAKPGDWMKVVTWTM